ncbi:MAG: Hsp20/alpha crystallin family protein [Planctomycetota bacterium]|nr:MAG: Hsp20/alpha crystallin family protein [Planctomycetota bacterium]
MLATRWQPRSIWSEMNRLREEMERAFGGNGLRQFDTYVYPPLNLWEDDNNLYVEAELPGFELSDIEIFVNGDNQLVLKGERKPPEVEGGTWHRQERGYGAFNRMVELPEHVDPDKVTAEFKNGVLTVTMPKREDAKPRRIEVKAN